MRNLWFYVVVQHGIFFLIITAFQEIDAITTQPSSENAGSAPEASDQKPAAGGESNQQPSEFAYDTQYSLAGGNCSNSRCHFWSCCLVQQVYQVPV